ncbi:Gfo/Idh/MocA family protein [Paenibacillus mendelii]|uniref:Gfo/Idh/MocA family protein n=1 Tax=Paenibacillus mendelii TaxID=206163 RepID=A0ABV6JJU6_9BACL|nr:Gfo/Idh/MocA family oxidoreductase [Paenibacillus mendelii]MCQ6559132.1 Gfo/Idh/MocA family oxidoreductase [Paenibacillus mendelii]
MRIRTALYGSNGHQIQQLLENHPQAELVATACLDLARLPASLRNDPNVRHYATLNELLADPTVQLVSLCSPFRSDQAEDAIQCMRAGKHVYAEKPCALSEKELDAIIAATRSTGCRFREMAGTAFEQPYLSMRNLVQAGAIGEIVQVFAQKSYPYFEERPQDERIDGGLARQAGVHAVRFIEHVANQKVSDIAAVETRLGNPDPSGGLHMAASFMMRLVNGGVASAVVNYLNPVGFKRWGNEHLRVFGTMGFMEATDGGVRTRLVVGDRDLGEIDRSDPSRDYFDMYMNELVDLAVMPLDLEEELHPTRMVIRAKSHI